MSSDPTLTFSKTNLLLLFWVRTCNVNGILPKELVNLMFEYQKYVILFDIYNKNSVHVKKTKFSQIVSYNSQNYKPTFLIASKPIEKLNSVVTVKYFKKSNHFCFGFLTKLPNTLPNIPPNFPIFNDWGGKGIVFWAHYGGIYQIKGNNKFSQISEAYYTSQNSRKDRIVKPNHSAKMKMDFKGNWLEFYKNGKSIAKHPISLFRVSEETKFYWYIAFSTACKFEVF